MQIYAIADSMPNAGKSPIHIHMQAFIQTMLADKDVFLEYRFPAIGRIADAVWLSKKIVFECQVSPISAEEVKARNQDYQSLGFTVVWLLHDRQFNRSKLKPAEIALSNHPHYFCNIDKNGKGYFYDQYSIRNFHKRIKLSHKSALSFRNPIYELPHRSQERKLWPLFFEEDLTQSIPADKKKSRSFLSYLFNLYRIALHVLLEKTTD